MDYLRCPLYSQRSQREILGNASSSTHLDGTVNHLQHGSRDDHFGHGYLPLDQNGVSDSSLRHTSTSVFNFQTSVRLL